MSKVEGLSDFLKKNSFDPEKDRLSINTFFGVSGSVLKIFYEGENSKLKLKSSLIQDGKLIPYDLLKFKIAKNLESKSIDYISADIEKIITLIKTVYGLSELKESITKQNAVLHSARVYLSYLENIRDNHKDSEEIQKHIKKVSERITLIGNTTMTPDELNKEIDDIFSFEDVLKWYDYWLSSPPLGKFLYDTNLVKLKKLLKDGVADKSNLNEILSNIGNSVSSITGKLDRTPIADDTLGVSDPRLSKSGDAKTNYSFDVSNSGLDKNSQKIQRLFKLIEEPMSKENDQKDDLFYNIKNGDIRAARKSLREMIDRYSGLDKLNKDIETAEGKLKDLKALEDLYAIKAMKAEKIKILKDYDESYKLVNDFDWLDKVIEQISQIKKKKDSEVVKIKQRLIDEHKLLKEESKKRPTDKKLKESLLAYERILKPESINRFADLVFESSLDMMVIQALGHTYMSNIMKNDKSLEDKYPLYADIIGTGFFNPSDSDLTSRFGIAEELVIQTGLFMISFGAFSIAEAGVATLTRGAVARLGGGKLATLASSKGANILGETAKTLVASSAFTLTNEALNNIIIGENLLDLKSWEELTVGKFVGDFALFGIFKYLAFNKIFPENIKPFDKVNLKTLLIGTTTALGSEYLSNLIDGKDCDITAEEFAYLFAIGLVFQRAGVENMKLNLSRLNGVLQINGKSLQNYLSSFNKKSKDLKLLNNADRLNKMVDKLQDVSGHPGSVSVEITLQGSDVSTWRLEKSAIKQVVGQKGNPITVSLYSDGGMIQTDCNIVVQKGKAVLRVGNNKGGYVDIKLN